MFARAASAIDSWSRPSRSSSNALGWLVAPERAPGAAGGSRSSWTSTRRRYSGRKFTRSSVRVSGTHCLDKVCARKQRRCPDRSSAGRRSATRSARVLAACAWMKPTQEGQASVAGGPPASRSGAWPLSGRARPGSRRRAAVKSCEARDRAAAARRRSCSGRASRWLSSILDARRCSGASPAAADRAIVLPCAGQCASYTAQAAGARNVRRTRGRAGSSRRPPGATTADHLSRRPPANALQSAVSRLGDLPVAPHELREAPRAGRVQVERVRMDLPTPSPATEDALLPRSRDALDRRISPELFAARSSRPPAAQSVVSLSAHRRWARRAAPCAAASPTVCPARCSPCAGRPRSSRPPPRRS